MLIGAAMSCPRRPAARRHADGFTLLDLIIAVTILGVLMGIVIPTLKDAVARTHAASTRSAITTTLFDALRHATVLGREIVVCPASASQCAGGTDWSPGWIAFIDTDGNRLHSPDEQIVRQQEKLPAGVRLHGTIGRQRIVYQPNGGNGGSNITFTLCDRRGPKHAQALILSNGGRLRSERAAPAAAAACASGL
jgi:type IV fimbrial biogenesis protein FimT